MSKGVQLIANERDRQINELGYTYENDSLYADEQLAKAGAAYALPKEIRQVHFDHGLFQWPWSIEHWNPSPENRIKELSKAGALIAAQIDYIINSEKLNKNG